MKIQNLLQNVTLVAFLITATFAVANNNDPVKKNKKGTTSEMRSKESATIVGVAAGNENVWIKIHWEGTRLYYWVIDDVTLSEAYDNDLQIEHKKLEFDLLGVDDVDESVFYMIPKTLLGGGGFDNFEAGVENFGEFAISLVNGVRTVKEIGQITFFSQFHIYQAYAGALTAQRLRLISQPDIYKFTGNIF